jgi:hypothetical protein
MGAEALSYASGSFNVGVGAAAAMHYGVVGDFPVWIAQRGGTGSYNTAIGYRAGTEGGFDFGNNTQNNVTINTKFGLNGSVGTWTYNDGGIEQIMPWYSNCSGYLKTSKACSGGSWWGTIISQPSLTPAPWISGGCGTEGCMPNPGIIWYWVR